VRHNSSVTPEQVSRFERLVGTALAALEAETRARFARLRDVGSAGTGDQATDAYWPTAQALHARRLLQERFLHAAVRLVARAAGGPPAVPGSEWGDTARALDH
jgi:hypothetical protein